MTLLFFDGLQDAAVMPKPEWDVGGWTWSSQTGRDGSANGAGMTGFKYLALPSAAATVVAGLAFQVASGGLFGNSVSTLVSFGVGGATGTAAMTMIGVSPTGLLEARWGPGNVDYRTATLIGTAAHVPLVVGVWHSLQVRLTPHASAGALELLLDGVSVLSVSGVKTNGSSTPVTHLALSGSNANGNNFLSYFDDLWVCDAVDASATQGRPNNGYLGDLKVVTLIPSANGDQLDWVPSTGTNHAALVDEVPPNTSDYVSASVVGARDLFAMTDLPGPGVVYGVRAAHYSLKTDTGASSVKTLLKEAGGTITAQAAQPLSVSAAAYAGPFAMSKPSAPGTVWSAADINALQVGVELA
jgi:hypothetical protein